MGTSKPLNTILLWVLTVVITLGSVVYQRMTGPTYPVSGSTEIDGQGISYRFLTSEDTGIAARMEIYAPDQEITGEVRWRRFRSYDKWTTEPLERLGDNLTFAIPSQPPAGKVMYQVSLTDKEGAQHELTSNPVIIRFKGAVPLFILIPHILCMFVGMLFATRSGLEAIAGRGNAFILALWTTILLTAGGLVLGPIVQKYAFGAFWTGWPFGHDLTDTKTAVAVIAWIVALWRLKAGKGGRWAVVIAAIITFAVYLIPHSALGSELDYTNQA